jgi:hypothetical protein
VAQGHAAHYARVEQNATEQLRAELAAARKRLVEAARYQVGHTPVERERERERERGSCGRSWRWHASDWWRRHATRWGTLQLRERERERREQLLKLY